MIKSSKEREKISESDLVNILKPHEEHVVAYISNDLIYDFFPFVLASAFNYDCMWDDSTLEDEYIDAIDYVNSLGFPKYKKLDIDRIKKIMEDKYQLKIISEKPIKIEKIQ